MSQNKQFINFRTVFYIFIKKQIFWFAFVSIASFIIYLLTLSETIYYGDSAEFIVTGLKNGVPHPPGYPLFVAIAHLFSKIPFGSVAWRINLLSAVFGSLSAGMVFLIIKLLTRNKLFSISVALFYAFMPLFWLYSLVAEVFSINNFFLSLILFLIIFALKHPKKQFVFPLISFCFSLGLTGHQLIFFYTPALIYLFIVLKIYTKPKIILYGFVAFVLGQIPQLYLWYVASKNPFYNWGDPDTLARFTHHILRLDYGTFKLGGFSESGQQTLGFVSFYVSSIWKQVGILLLFLPFGLYTFWKISKKLFWVIFISLLFFGPIFLWYTGLPTISIVQKAIGERFYMQSMFFIFIISVVGLYRSSRMIKSFGPISFWKLLNIVLFVYVVFQVTNFYPKIDQKNNNLFESYAKNAFLSLPKNSLYLVGSATTDAGLMGSIYMQQVLGLRPDIKVVNISLLPADWYRETLKSYYPDLGILKTGPDIENRELYKELCRNSSKQPTYIEGWIKGLTPMDNDNCTFVQKGIVIQLLPKDYLVDIDRYKVENDALWGSYKLPLTNSEQVYDLRTKEVFYFYSQARIVSGLTYINHSKYDWAKEEFEKAWGLSKDNGFAASYLATAIHADGKLEEAISLEARALQISPNNVNSYLNLGAWYIEIKDKKKARFYLSEYLKLFPEDNNKEYIQNIVDSLKN